MLNFTKKHFLYNDQLGFIFFGHHISSVSVEGAKEQYWWPSAQSIDSRIGARTQKRLFYLHTLFSLLCEPTYLVPIRVLAVFYLSTLGNSCTKIPIYDFVSQCKKVFEMLIPELEYFFAFLVVLFFNFEDIFRIRFFCFKRCGTFELKKRQKLFFKVKVTYFNLMKLIK